MTPEVRFVASAVAPVVVQPAAWLLEPGQVRVVDETSVGSVLTTEPAGPIEGITSTNGRNFKGRTSERHGGGETPTGRV